MDENKADSAYENVFERNEEHYRAFRQRFENEIASGEPMGDKTRFQILEHMLHELNNEIKTSNLKYVSDMIASLDEEKIIESKK